ncbi:MAG: Rid family detoxifying hydrolase [Saprospiraceae bacterium]|nr:Rid family detoxifying hydrolase [Saprospiraceae bacterium]
MKKRILETANAPAPVGPYSQAVWYGDMLFASGQIAIDPSSPTGELVLDTIEAETHQVLKNIGAILAEGGLDYSHVLKASVFVKDMNQYSRINAVYLEYFGEDFAPARELVEVANLPKFVNVEISVIAGK